MCECCKVTKWEYTIVWEWEHDSPQAVLAEYGKLGWELVGFTTQVSCTDSMREVLYTFVLKRPLSDPASEGEKKCVT